METEPTQLWKLIGIIVGGAGAVTATAVGLVRSIPSRPSNGQKEFLNSLRRDVDRIIEHDEKRDDRLGAIEQNVSTLLERTR